MPYENENLKELLSGFLQDADAERAAEDIRRGQELFKEHTAPAPAAEVLEQIKSQMSDKLASKPATGVRWARRSVAAAAVVALVGLITAVFWPAQPAAVAAPPWPTEEFVTAADAEMDNVLEAMITISRNEYDFTEDALNFDEMELDELEEVAFSDDFWKG